MAWTAVAREVKKKIDEDIKILPCEGDGKNITKFVRSPVFENNPYIAKTDEKSRLFPLFLNNPQANYCKTDTPLMAHHRYDKHMIAQMCEFYGIESPELKCEMYFTNYERDKVKNLVSDLGVFITIEPVSKTNYTPNREYPFAKWQKVVNDLSRDVTMVQLGAPASRLLNNVTDFRGKTSFREAALVIGESKAFLSSEGGLVHAATTVDTTSVVVITGYQHPDMVAYPQNVNINLGKHGPCGLKVKCDECFSEVMNHNYSEIITKTRKLISI
ncbi:MAG: hypothetical protein HOJ16_00370 [Candidatus Peribacter sp.]|nr:hypothetical protein [Candidatus Peribacter sp.]MBT6053779.1 hypothetical protein [Candidatus Scalindua sp.]